MSKIKPLDVLIRNGSEETCVDEIIIILDVWNDTFDISVDEVKQDDIITYTNFKYLFLRKNEFEQWNVTAPLKVSTITELNQRGWRLK